MNEQNSFTPLELEKLCANIVIKNLWNNDEYTFKNSYNKLTAVLKVKSHHLVTSEDRWYDYECIMKQ